MQGVCYRAGARERAEDLGVTGYARNLPDGSVEVLACGSAAAVEEFGRWLWQGPPAASVTAVVIEELDPRALQPWPERFRTV